LPALDELPHAAAIRAPATRLPASKNVERGARTVQFNRFISVNNYNGRLLNRDVRGRWSASL
jgi:hypothetical protein